MLLNLQMIYGRADPLESYCAHFLLSQDEIYFSVLESKGSRSIYSPRSTEQVFLVHFFLSYLLDYVIFVTRRVFSVAFFLGSVNPMILGFHPSI